MAVLRNASGQKRPERRDVKEAYYASVAAEVKKWDAVRKPTDIERTALALARMGKDITDVDGVNLAAMIYNSENLTDGSDELAYALVALDAAQYHHSIGGKMVKICDNRRISEVSECKMADSD